MEPVTSAQVPAQAIFDHMGHQATDEVRQVPSLFDIALKPALKLYEIGGVEKQNPNVAKRNLRRHQNPSRSRAMASAERSGASNQYSSSSGAISVSITSRNQATGLSRGSVGVT